MAKFDEIKVGDIVFYDGRIARVMEKTGSTRPVIRIVGPTVDDSVHPTDVQLMKSIELPKLKVGDRVRVDDVPTYERPRIDGIWVSDMVHFIGNEYIVEELWDHSQYGHLAKLGDWWFRTYHLSPVTPYDMI